MLNNIQGLRAIAALLVVLHHAGAHYSAMGGDNALILALAQWGYVGVDLFFVISGFIITHTTMSKPRGLQGAATFAWHRLARIYLGYWPFFLVMLALVYTISPAGLDTVNLVSSFLLTSSDQPLLLLPVSWSLAFELYFYALFAFSFWVPVRLLPRIIACALVGTSAWFLVSGNDDKTVAGFLLSPYLIEFLFGACIRLVAHHLSGVYVRTFCSVLAVGAVANGIHTNAYLPSEKVFTFGLASAAILALAVSRKNMPATGFFSIVERIGDASYTIYLSHLVILWVFYFSGLRDWFTRPGSIYPELGLGAVFLFCVCFSLVYYRTIELPVYRRATSFLKSRPAPIPAKT